MCAVMIAYIDKESMVYCINFIFSVHMTHLYVIELTRHWFW